MSAALQMARRLAEFRELRARGALCTGVTEQLAEEAADTFLHQYHAQGEYLRDAIILLAEIATLEEPCLSQPGIKATFPLLVEKLSDSFDPELCRLYDRAFAQMISVTRKLPAAARLDTVLNRFGLRSEADLLARRERLREQQPRLNTDAVARLKKVLVLSRVTLGADVAITSVVLHMLRQAAPRAQRVLLGPAKAQELFGGDASLRIYAVPYSSRGSLLERLDSWFDILSAIEEELRGLRPEEYLLLDPDSRYLQLGLLPAIADESRYLFFESRSAAFSEMKSLSTVAGEWLSNVLEGASSTAPNICLREADVQFGGRVGSALRAGGAKHIVAMSFGVGGNVDKRIGESFERNLMQRLITDGVTILLDKGEGAAEEASANTLVESVRQSGGGVSELTADNEWGRWQLSPRLVTWKGGIGAWAGLIAASDEYIGYDSAGQHIAAACGVPGIDIFPATAAPIFRSRWRPTGRTASVVLTGGAHSDSAAAAALLEDVMRAHGDIRTAITHLSPGK